MGNLKIKEYSDEMMPEMKLLLEKIYKEKPALIKKLTYFNNAPNHILTVVATEGDEIIGQANMFLKPRLNGIVNIGFHVDPRYRSKGIGTTLVRELITKGRNKGYSEFHIITESVNKPACRVAEKLNFNIDHSVKLINSTTYKKIG